MSCVFKPFYCRVQSGLSAPLTCLGGLRYMLNFNMSLVFYKPSANVYPAETREQCYHVINFDIVEFDMYGRLS